MSAVVRIAAAGEKPSPRIALLGTGVVGSAFVQRYLRFREQGLSLPAFAWLANSRIARDVGGNDARQVLEEARSASTHAGDIPPWTETEALQRGDFIVDATGSEIVADRHAEWLARGIHVVTANKLGQGGPSWRAQAIRKAVLESGARYGDGATVGAGLPLIRSIRALVQGGDRIHRVEGVLSGSLAWLFNHYDGSRPFSGFVREASRAGYTEPNPRIDLSGEDVRRKLLILARASGRDLQSEDVQVESLVPPALVAKSLDELEGALEQLDAPVAERFLAAEREGSKLRFIGRFDENGAKVGLQALAPDHPLCGGAGTDNKVAIFSDRYNVQPLVIQGPGAGAEVTAAALLDDVLAIAGS